MLNFLDQAKRWLREFVEIGFLILLALILIHLLIGQTAGGYVASVADNVAKFTGRDAGRADRHRHYCHDDLPDDARTLAPR